MHTYIHVNKYFIYNKFKKITQIISNITSEKKKMKYYKLNNKKAIQFNQRLINNTTPCLKCTCTYTDTSSLKLRVSDAHRGPDAVMADCYGGAAGRDSAFRFCRNDSEPGPPRRR